MFGLGLWFALGSQGSRGAVWLAGPHLFLHPFVTKKQGRKLSVKVVMLLRLLMRRDASETVDETGDCLK